MARRKPVHWTPKMLASLRHMWRIEGLPVPEIARKLGVTYRAVLYRAAVENLCEHPSKSGPAWRGNLRIPRVASWPGDISFWRQSDIEVPRA